MSDEYVRTGEFSRYADGTNGALSRLQADIDEVQRQQHAAELRAAELREADLERIRTQREADVQAAALALTTALKELGESRNTSWVRRIGAVGAGAGVVAAWVALIELLHAYGR